MIRRAQHTLEELVRLCRQSDEPAWHELIDLVGPVIFALCRRSRLTRDESFDIYGQVCLELVKSIDSIREAEKLPAVVATITRRQIYSFYQKLRMVEIVGDESLELVADDCADHPEKVYEQARRRQALLAAMSELNDRDFRLLTALFLDPEEPSYKEIARALKMPVSSIGPLRGKALDKLCRILKRKKFNF